VPRFYITTPIYYVNAVPHLGTFYSTVVDDALARYHRARYGKENVFFLTGLDEHGQKIERIARQKGMEPQVYCDGIAEKFEATWARAGITNDDFIRTTEPRHTKPVQTALTMLKEQGDLYEDFYEGWYSPTAERFWTRYCDAVGRDIGVEGAAVGDVGGMPHRQARHAAGDSGNALRRVRLDRRGENGRPGGAGRGRLADEKRR
jgi:methionyl-tRNA synthetase